MSTATTNAQALGEFVADLKRINPKRADFLAAVDAACVTLQENSQAQKRQIAEATGSFLTKVQADAEAHIEAELTAKEATRAAFDAQPEPLALPAVGK